MRGDRLNADLRAVIGECYRRQGRVFAGAGDAASLVGLEDGAVGCADKMTFLILQKLVRRPVQRPALMWTDVQPGSSLPLMACCHKIATLSVGLDLELDELAFEENLRSTKELALSHGVFPSMNRNNPWVRFYQPPRNPLARFGLVLLGIALLALSFMLGLVFLAVAAGLAIIGGIALTVRRWLGLGQTRRSDDQTIDVEYRVIRRDRDPNRDRNR